MVERGRNGEEEATIVKVVAERVNVSPVTRRLLRHVLVLLQLVRNDGGFVLRKGRVAQLDQVLLAQTTPTRKRNMNVDMRVRGSISLLSLPPLSTHPSSPSPSLILSLSLLSGRRACLKFEQPGLDARVHVERRLRGRLHNHAKRQDAVVLARQARPHQVAAVRPPRPSIIDDVIDDIITSTITRAKERNHQHHQHTGERRRR